MPPVAAKICASIPESLYRSLDREANVTQQLLALARAGLADGERLPQIARERRKPQHVGLPDDLVPALEALRGRRSVEPDATLAGIFARAAVHGWQLQNAPPEPAAVEVMTPAAKAGAGWPLPDNGYGWRSEQLGMLDRLQAAADAGKVALLESATGTGKGLVLAAFAYERVRCGKAPVVIASPTHAIAEQTRRELEQLTAAHGPVRVCALRGRQEFVSEQLLDGLLSDLDQEISDAARVAEIREQAAAWKAKQADEALPWLGESLEVEVDVDVSRCRLDVAREGDAGEVAYQAMRGDAREAEIVLCTHMMLARDALVRRDAGREGGLRWSDGGFDTIEAFALDDAASRQAISTESDVLPEYRFLLVDEAHVLEEQIASAMSDVISFAGLRSRIARLREAGVKGLAMATDEVERVFSKGQAIGQYEDPRLVSAERVAELVRSTQQIVKQALSCLARSKQRGKLALDEAILSRQRRALDSVARGLGTGSMVRFDCSPFWAFPTLSIGPQHIDRELIYLWRYCCRFDGAGLVSATMYAPDGRGGLSLRHMQRNVLSVPESLHLAPVPGSAHRFAPKWVYAPVTSHVVRPGMGGARRHPLCPPEARDATSDDDGREAWHRAVAACVREIAGEQGSGGTLVLCTSYDTAERVGALLADSLWDRLLVSRQGSSVQGLRMRYLRMVEEDVCPVWLGVGPCWTGLSLRRDGVPAAEDNALTNLIIPRLPLGLNRSTTHRKRVERAGSGFLHEVYSSALMFRQGLGRMVRQEGVSPRDLWVLDPRLNDRTIQWSAAFLAVMGDYARHGKVVAYQPPEEPV